MGIQVFFKVVFFILLLFGTVVVTAQQKAAYAIYNLKGKKVSYKKMLGKVATSDIVLFGEFHNNPISHWLQLELSKDVAKNRTLMMGAEMFEQDNQVLLDAYLQGSISEKRFDSAARLWSNYKTDYAPLVNYAREHKLVFVASNVPRRYASMVSRAGFEALEGLPTVEKAWMAPLPIAFDSTLPGYKKMLEMMPGHSNALNFPKAQALKDATMAYFIRQYYKPGNLFIHFNGAYHSDYFEGILWYLKKDMPLRKYVTISTVTQRDLSKLLAENKGKADFIIVVDEDMTTTY